MQYRVIAYRDITRSRVMINILTDSLANTIKNGHWGMVKSFYFFLYFTWDMGYDDLSIS